MASEGDLYLYLGTGSGGTATLFNPTGPVQGSVLPFTANYLVRLAGGITPTLYSATGGDWTHQKEVTAVNSGELNDVLLPFADLGITDPAATSLKLLGVVAANGTLDVWATVPDQNLGRVWGAEHRVGSPGRGHCAGRRGLGRRPYRSVQGDGQSVTSATGGRGRSLAVTVTVQNVGSAALPSLTMNGMANRRCRAE